MQSRGYTGVLSLPSPNAQSPFVAGVTLCARLVVIWRVCGKALSYNVGEGGTAASVDKQANVEPLLTSLTYWRSKMDVCAAQAVVVMLSNVGMVI